MIPRNFEHKFILQCDPRFEVTSDTKAQIKFLDELDKLEKKRHDDQEKEILLKAAKVVFSHQQNFDIRVHL